MSSAPKFGEQEFQDIGRPLKSLVVVISWSCLLVFGVVKLFHWSSFLSLWTGIAFSVGTVAIVKMLMQIFIMFSQSERSTPAKVAPAVKNEVPAEESREKQN